MILTTDEQPILLPETKMLSRVTFCATILVGLCTALAIDTQTASSAPEASIHPLHIFPDGIGAETLSVRKDGSVLLGMIYPSALLYYFATPTSTPILLHNFTGLAGAYGLTEYAPDVFAVVTGTFSRSGTVLNATGTIWRVDLTKFRTEEDGTITSPAYISKLATLTDVGFLNGAATLNADTVLVADSARGVVFSVDTQSGNYSVALNDMSMAPNTTGLVRLGVNGLRIVNDTLYYTNTNRRYVGKVQLNVDGTAAGPYQTIVTNTLLDDLEVDPMTGAIYLPGLAGNIVTYVAPNGTATVVAGSLNSTEIPGPTSLRFAKDQGCGREQSTKLIVSACGGIEYPVNGAYTGGGGLYELDVSQVLP